MSVPPVATSCRPVRRCGNSRFRKTRLSANRPSRQRRSWFPASRRVVLLGPFGEPLTTPAGVGLELPFRFSTKYQDAETGLLYYGYRYYDPITGRWLSRDPIGEEAFWQLLKMEFERKAQFAAFRHVSDYGMVGNNPLNQIDYLGLATTLHLQAPILIARAVAARNIASLQIWLAGLGAGATRLVIAVQNSLDRISMEQQALSGATQSNVTATLMNYVRAG